MLNKRAKIILITLFFCSSIILLTIERKRKNDDWSYTEEERLIVKLEQFSRNLNSYTNNTNNILWNPLDLTHHKYLLMSISSIKVHLLGREFTLNDVCFKPHNSLFTRNGSIDMNFPELIKIIELEAKQLSPCLIISSINCFHDSYEIHSEISRWNGNDYLNKRLRDAYIDNSVTENSSRPYVEEDESISLIQKWSKLYYELYNSGNETSPKLIDWDHQLNKWVENLNIDECSSKPCYSIDDTDYNELYSSIEPNQTISMDGSSFESEFSERIKFENWFSQKFNKTTVPSTEFDYQKISSDECGGIFKKSYAGLVNDESLYSEFHLLKSNELLADIREKSEIYGWDNEWSIDDAVELISHFREAIRDVVESFNALRINEKLNMETKVHDYPFATDSLSFNQRCKFSEERILKLIGVLLCTGMVVLVLLFLVHWKQNLLTLFLFILKFVVSIYLFKTYSHENVFWKFDSSFTAQIVILFVYNLILSSHANHKRKYFECSNRRITNRFMNSNGDSLSENLTIPSAESSISNLSYLLRYEYYLLKRISIIDGFNFLFLKLTLICLFLSIQFDFVTECLILMLPSILIHYLEIGMFYWLTTGSSLPRIRQRLSVNEIKCGTASENEMSMNDEIIAGRNKELMEVVETSKRIRTNNKGKPTVKTCLSWLLDSIHWFPLSLYIKCISLSKQKALVINCIILITSLGLIFMTMVILPKTGFNTHGWKRTNLLNRFEDIKFEVNVLNYSQNFASANSVLKDITERIELLGLSPIRNWYDKFYQKCHNSCSTISDLNDWIQEDRLISSIEFDGYLWDIDRITNNLTTHFSFQYKLDWESYENDNSFMEKFHKIIETPGLFDLKNFDIKIIPVGDFPASAYQDFIEWTTFIGNELQLSTLHFIIIFCYTTIDLGLKGETFCSTSSFSSSSLTEKWRIIIASALLISIFTTLTRLEVASLIWLLFNPSRAYLSNFALFASFVANWSSCKALIRFGGRLSSQPSDSEVGNRKKKIRLPLAHFSTVSSVFVWIVLGSLISLSIVWIGFAEESKTILLMITTTLMSGLNSLVVMMNTVQLFDDNRKAQLHDIINSSPVTLSMKNNLLLSRDNLSRSNNGSKEFECIEMNSIDNSRMESRTSDKSDLSNVQDEEDDFDDEEYYDEEEDEDEEEVFYSDDEGDEEVHATMARLYRRWNEMDEEVKEERERKAFILNVLNAKKNFISHMGELKTRQQRKKEYLTALAEFEKSRNAPSTSNEPPPPVYEGPHPLAHQFPPHFTYEMIDFITNPEYRNEPWYGGIYKPEVVEPMPEVVTVRPDMIVRAPGFEEVEEEGREERRHDEDEEGVSDDEGIADDAGEEDDDELLN